MKTDADDFVTVALLKRDHFSETVSGHAKGDPTRKLTRRNLATLPAWTKPIARRLAAREARALEAVKGISGVPEITQNDRNGLTRTWLDGRPLQIARPAGAGWYDDARRLLDAIHSRGVTHNDLAKPQNWLERPDGSAAVIDFQLAMVHRGRGRLYRLGVYEDLRHLAKQKQRFAPHLLSETEQAMLAARSVPSRLWHASGKRLYNYITRDLMSWSDGEGAGVPIRDAATARATLLGMPGVREVHISPCAVAGGTGLYAFVTGTSDEATLRREAPVDFLQVVDRLPPAEALDLIASNRVDALEDLLEREPDLAETVLLVAQSRKNLTDRYLKT